MTDTTQQQVRRLTPADKALLDEQLDGMFEAAGQTGVDTKHIYSTVWERDADVDSLEIYNALQRAKSRLKLKDFAPDPNRPGKIWYRLPSGDTT